MLVNSTICFTQDTHKQPMPDARNCEEDIPGQTIEQYQRVEDLYGSKFLIDSVQYAVNP